MFNNSSTHSESLGAILRTWNVSVKSVKISENFAWTEEVLLINNAAMLVTRVTKFLHSLQ